MAESEGTRSENKKRTESRAALNLFIPTLANLVKSMTIVVVGDGDRSIEIMTTEAWRTTKAETYHRRKAT
ncbi:hypothetical protein PIB30_002862 [Stylosanthes scabra]|uniref:Uncharacterized protein n=1 Tax=Stylosanthes scabra TaxID=79078 RepID=A0ABU6T2U6_9FABA|nr:hypothetical protein [Stylosanthes scabra]